MIRLTTIIMVAMAFCAVAIVSPAVVTAQPKPPAEFTPSEETPEQFPDAPGREEAFYGCVACHNFKLIAAQGLDRERWDASITFMTQRHGMPEPDAADREKILNYLVAAFPPRAPAQQRGWQNPFAPK